MIITETEGNFRRTYSNRGVLIHGGYPESDYAEAVDPIDTDRTYTETEIPIEQDEDDQFAEAGRILMGVIK